MPSLVMDTLLGPVLTLEVPRERLVLLKIEDRAVLARVVLDRAMLLRLVQHCTEVLAGEELLQ